LSPFAFKRKAVWVRAGYERLPDWLGVWEVAAAAIIVRYHDDIPHNAAFVNQSKMRHLDRHPHYYDA
jgi:hypothetical protein